MEPLHTLQDILLRIVKHKSLMQGGMESLCNGQWFAAGGSRGSFPSDPRITVLFDVNGAVCSCTWFSFLRGILCLLLKYRNLRSLLDIDGSQIMS